MNPEQRPLPALAEIAAEFDVSGRFLRGAPYGTGHINDTYAIECEVAGTPARYILQRINQRVFRDVEGLMENIARVTSHIGRVAAAEGNGRRALTLVSTRQGATFHRDAAGSCWRCYVFIEGARTYDVIEHPAQAREAARAFGRFQHQLVDLPGGRLRETIPYFHDTVRRFGALREAIAADAHGRCQVARAEIEFALAREKMTGVLLELLSRGEIAERVTHNDTKLNNVMLDDVTGEGVCVIDLDTVMPGLALYDFGDMVRTATNSAAEDEIDLGRVECRLPIFEALAEGYLATAGDFLNEAERAHLVFSGQLMTYEVGIRFLTDFLSGDVYFKTRRSEHNLERARNQFALLRSMEHQRTALEACIERQVAS